MRIVSLACSNTEIVCAVGGARDLVGVDDHSDFPLKVVFVTGGNHLDKLMLCLRKDSHSLLQSQTEPP